GLLLVGRLLVRKTALELELPGGVLRIGVPLERCARAIKLHQFLSEVAHGASDPGFGTDPFATSQARERWFGVARPDVAPDAVSLGDGDIQVVAFGVVEQQELR